MNFKFEFGDLFKIPNILCYIRILLVPLFLYIFFTATEPKDYYIATSVVMISGATDFLDGQIARKFNMVKCTSSSLLFWNIQSSRNC